jgi:hypothetical protein
MSRKELEALFATARQPRQRAQATGDMRERLAAAIRGSRPTHLAHLSVKEACDVFYYEMLEQRQWYERWADDLLRCVDAMDLEIIDIAEER